MNERKLKRLKKMLQEKKQEILEDVREMKKDGLDVPMFAQDVGDRALRNYERDMIYQLTNQERQILILIDEALLRIEKNQYGLCVECSKPIQDARLKAVPWARHCVSCQELQEKGMIL